MTAQLFSLIVAFCAPNAEQISTKYCEKIAMDVAMTADECIHQQWTLIERYTSKGVPVALVSCQPEQGEE